MSDAQLVAEKIMALVDEYPSEPFSFERKQLVDKIYLTICKHTQQVSDDAENYYNQGYEEGSYEGKQEATGDLESEIQELEDEIEELRQELSELNNKLDQIYLEGFEEGQNQDRMR